MYPSDSLNFSYEAQSIGLEGVPNARQLGGYVAADGRKIKQNMLFRCGVLSNATENDKKILSEKYQIKHVFDLRTAFELNLQPDGVIEGTTYTNMPIEDVDNNIWKIMFSCEGETPHDQLLNFSRTERAQRMVEKMYTGYVSDEYCQLQYAAFLDKLINIDGPILWHCTQGKDRTGLASAFLLAALGIDREIIIKDFYITNTTYQKTVDRLAAKLKEQDLNRGIPYEETIKAIEVIQSLEGVNTEYFIAALDYIETIYGSIERYLKVIFAITDSEINILRDKFLE